MKQPLRAAPQKQLFTQINNRIRQILEKHLNCKWAPTGIPQVYLTWSDYFKENPWMVASKLPFTIKIKILFTKFAHIYR